MSRIQVLDQITIDKIAAGEVIERPASIVKELTENSIDAGATAVTAEIRDGGISFIRISDNGCGIDPQEVRAAFLRHSTSKIRTVEDLTNLSSLGFRGEALSSIAAVSQVELLTKTKECTYGTAYRIEGGKEISLEEAGAPDGTTFLVRQLFYNTPARRKFLKTAMTEASHVGDLITRLALSHPEISFQFINNQQIKLHTSGSGNVGEVIYHIYGREISAHLLEISEEKNGIRISGYIGEPVISRGNRNFQTYFVNGRYIKSNLVSRAVEDAYKDFSMQHKYPFAVLYIAMDGEGVDVNVHPSKMELRFRNQQEVYQTICEAIGRTLHRGELIPEVSLPEPSKSQPKENSGQPLPSAEDKKSGTQDKTVPSKRDLDYFMKKMQERVRSYHLQNSSAEVRGKDEIFRPNEQENRIREAVNYRKNAEASGSKSENRQLNLFDDKLLARQSVPEYHLIGQVFKTYWLVEFGEQLYIIDQHAAHERVLYERTLAGMRTREYTSQNISPPIILDLPMRDAELLRTYHEHFSRIGFEIEEFGQDSFAVRAVPDNLFGIAQKDLLLEMLDRLSDELVTETNPRLVAEKIASMSCKAAVKGNMTLSADEVRSLIGELLKLDNPYHCPHGRPTIISISKRELEKKFKRIV